MITRMELHAFTAFEHIELGWSEGLNVLLGAGGAGKTHLLKVAGAGAGAAPDSGAEGSRQLGTRLAGAFGLAGEHIGMLVRRTDAGWAPRAHASVESNNGVRSIEFRPQDEIVPPGATPQVNESARWIGTRIPATAGVGIEEGAVDNPLAGALERATGRRLANWKSIHVLTGPGEPEAAANPLASETQRRLTAAALAVDRLEPGTTVLWDNPETGIEAAARGELAQALLELAAGGAQVGIATHDYALLKEIDLASTPGQVRYHQLKRNGAAGTRCTSVESYVELDKTAIARTFSKLYNSELTRSLGEQGNEPR